MESLKAFIEKVDDDYLIGLSNKGIVKRAYKDLEQEKPSVTWQGEEIQVSLREETCILRMPLGESTCSCPSHSICRHIVTAVLWMKREMEAGESPSCETQEQGEEAQGEEAALKNQPEEPPLLSELLQIPPERLKRACGNKRYAQFLAHMRSKELPPMTESSIVTVLLPWEKATVKLLEPAEHISCSCHSRELCAHKAQALLAYQLAKKKCTLEELEALKEPESILDRELVKQVCGGICQEICHQLCIGLSRTSKEAPESLLRLSVIAHRAALPALESSLREAGAYYEQYFSRSAAFRGGELMEKLLRLYQRARQLSVTEQEEEIRSLAGTFRDSYLPVGTLHLMGMGARAFSSKTGYEGEIYYFLETRQKQWYTWTDARPTFYEGRTAPGNQTARQRQTENAQAPWGLNCSRQQMQSLVFELQNARAASGRRLSVSQESRGEATAVRSPDLEEIREMIYWDYEKVVLDCIEQKETENSLALVGAVHWDNASFDKVKQRFSWNMYDEKDRRISIAMNYTKEEKLIINLLERLEQRLRKQPPGAIVFLGSFYVDEEGRPCLYPIEFFVREKMSENSGNTETSDASSNLPSREVVGSMEQYFREAERLLEDMFISGLSSQQGETLSECRRLAREGEMMGLHQAGRELSEIYKLLDGRRHQMEFSPEPVTLALGRLETCIRACRERLLKDKALICLRESSTEGQKQK